MPDDMKSVVSRVALAIKRAYCLHSRWARQIESYDPPDSKYGKYWTNAAIVCVTNRVNPVEFIEVLFAATKPHWPEIRQIGSAWAMEIYRKYARPYAYEHVNDFNIQLHAYEQLVKSRDPEAVLLDEEQEFDPLFIYSVAEANELTDLAQKYEEPAMAKYLTSVHYEQVYGDVIPQKFKDVAKDIREGAHAQRVD
jgi:hypothetical protein